MRHTCIFPSGRREIGILRYEHGSEFDDVYRRIVIAMAPLPKKLGRATAIFLCDLTIAKSGASKINPVTATTMSKARLTARSKGDSRSLETCSVLRSRPNSAIRDVRHVLTVPRGTM